MLAERVAIMRRFPAYRLGDLADPELDYGELMWAMDMAHIMDQAAAAPGRSG